MKEVGLLGFTERAVNLCKDIGLSLEKEGCNIEIYAERKGAKDFVAKSFEDKDTIIFVSASGICIRMIAPHIKSKDRDPAIIVMDEAAHFVIPILSGHLGGANEAALRLSELTGATPVITTATDINRVFAVDLWTKKAGCHIDDISQIKHISGGLLAGEKIGIISDFNVEGDVPIGISLLDGENFNREEFKAGIKIGINRDDKPFEHTLNAIPKVCTLGIGCKRDFPFDRLESFIIEKLDENKIPIESIKSLATIELKKDEDCIRKFSEKYNLPIEIYTADELMALEGDFSKSNFVNSVTGVDCVCERAAVKSSETHFDRGKLILKKSKGGGCTLAIALGDWKCRF